MNKLDIFKGVASLVAGAGVGKTVDLVLKNNLPTEMNWKTRLCTMIGSAVIGSFISSKCCGYIEDEIDDVANKIDNIKKMANQAMNQTDIVIEETVDVEE